MALIQCEECGKEISDKALTCPECGMPTLAQLDKTDTYKILAIILGIILIVFGYSNYRNYCDYFGKYGSWMGVINCPY